MKVYEEKLSSIIMNEEDKLFELKEFKGYKINRKGQVWSDKSNRFLKETLCNGYYQVNTNGCSNQTVHRLVAQTFIPNPDNKPYVNHKDSDKTNNKVENLEWVTQKENCAAHNKVISHVRKVIQMDMEGKVLNTFESLKKAGEHIDFSASAISKAVLNINPSAGGFLWTYDDTNYITCKDISKGKQIYEYVKYYIFPDGTVYNNVRKANVKPVKNAAGYAYVTISNNKTKRNYYVQRLVAEHFIPNNDKNKTQVNHKNKIRDDNRIENLEWVTPSENILHAKSKVPSL